MPHIPWCRCYDRPGEAEGHGGATVSMVQDMEIMRMKYDSSILHF